jgi:hypothetical protein
MYDMLQNLDIYGFNKRAQDAKDRFIEAYPSSPQTKKLLDEKNRRNSKKPDQDKKALTGIAATLLPQEATSINQSKRASPRFGKDALSEDKLGVISEQNKMARFIAGLYTNFGER